MLGLNRRDEHPHHHHHHDVDASGYDLRLDPAVARAPNPVVAVLGRPERIAGLPEHLPAGWSLRAARDLDDVRPGELVMVTHATTQDVVAARAMLPRRARIVAVVDERAPAELVTGVLTAGADVCVRGGHPAILAGHLVACRRRQLAERWAALSATATGERANRGP
ncbi:MAG TPA: hypothetical protein VFH03_04865 [Actinoplanes sp.]|nr:hypothetical protein [Actinoplanes sp.]